MVTLVGVVIHVEVVVLVADLDILQIERFGMTVVSTHPAILGGYVAVGILKRIKAFLNPFPDLIVWCAAAMPDAYINHEQRLGSKILGQL